MHRRGSSAHVLALPAPETEEVSRDVEQVYREHAATVSTWVRRLLGPRGDVEDVLHEVFLVVQRALPGFRGEARLTTWLYAITVRVVHRHRRKGRWLGWWRLRPPELESAATPTPLQMLESRQALEITYRLLDRLPEAERTALVLFELEGLSGEEIAAVTGDAVGTVWVRLHRARARFRAAFADWEAGRPRGGALP